jgi:formylglycine-generating enzyme
MTLAPFSTRRAVAVVVVVAVVATAWFVARRGGSRGHVTCAEGFFAVGARCCPSPLADASGCLPAAACPAPLVMRGASCDAPDARVRIPETTVEVGPSDWEAEGRVAPRTVRAGPFEIDAFEATLAHFAPNLRITDGARAQGGLSREAASAYCKNRNGRLPTEDEWIAAAAAGTSPSAPGHRYPWGETGAVCRRAAWGLASGPCSTVGTGPDTVGTHPSGDTPTGIHDMAGNVAEWVIPSSPDSHLGVVRGGSWQSSLATELRTWERLEIDPASSDPRVGVRCAYDVP